MRFGHKIYFPCSMPAVTNGISLSTGGAWLIDGWTLKGFLCFLEEDMCTALGPRHLQLRRAPGMTSPTPKVGNEHSSRRTVRNSNGNSWVKEPTVPGFRETDVVERSAYRRSSSSTFSLSTLISQCGRQNNGPQRCPHPNPQNLGVPPHVAEGTMHV